MKRKHANGRYTEEYQDHVVGWVAARAGRTGGEAGLHFGVDASTVRKWMRTRGVAPKPAEETYSPESNPSGAPRSRDRSRNHPPNLAGGKHRAPVSEMDTDDKDRAVRTVRNMSRIVDLRTAMMLANLEEAEKLLATIDGLENADPKEKAVLRSLLSLSKDDAQAMLNLARATSLIIDTHPGLLKLAGVKDSNERGQRNLAHVRAALGLKSGGE